MWDLYVYTHPLQHREAFSFRISLLAQMRVSKFNFGNTVSSRSIKNSEIWQDIFF